MSPSGCSQRAPAEFTVAAAHPFLGGRYSPGAGQPDSRSTCHRSHARLEPTACGYDPRLSRFVTLRRRWSPGDEITLQLELPITLQRAHPKVKGHAGKAALTRGPLVYCLESVDNPGVDIFSARLRADSLRRRSTPLTCWVGSGCCAAKPRAGTPVTAIPYHLWGNRGESQMNVWVNL